jgi:hypothetical protein
MIEYKSVDRVFHDHLQAGKITGQIICTLRGRAPEAEPA